MKLSSLLFAGNKLTTLLFGCLATTLAFMVLSGQKLPLVFGERVALVLLVVLGLGMCSAGAGRVAAAGSWRHPLALASSLGGILILFLAAAAGLAGWRLPLVSGPRDAIAATAVLSAAKLLLSAAHRRLA